jgi:hypothetical protein
MKIGAARIGVRHPPVSVMWRRNTSCAIRKPDPNILHHSLVFVIENVTMQHEIADIALI